MDYNSLLVDFWFRDLPELSGVWRIYIYGGLLALFLLSRYTTFAFAGADTSPWSSPEFYRYIAPTGFFEFEGFGKLLPTFWVSMRSLLALRAAVMACWVCCIVGFGGCVPPLVVGLGTFLLFAVSSATIGNNHRWYVPTYTLLALGFACGNRDLSLDALLAERLGADVYPFAPLPLSPDRHPLLSGSMARKFVLLAACSTLFNGGVAKMANAGLRWMDGLSLAYYTMINSPTKRHNGSLFWLKRLFSQSQAFAALMSVATMVLELGAPIVIFFPQLRVPFFVGAAGFHVGIWFTMSPNYFPQTLCYALGGAWWFEADKGAPAITATPQVVLIAQIATAFTAFVYWCGLVQFERWPFTSVPMYSFYRDRSFAHEYLQNEAQAQLVAREHVRSRLPNVFCWSDLWVTLRLTQTRAAPDFDVENTIDLSTFLCDTSAEFGVHRKHLRRSLQNAAAVDLHSRPKGVIGWEADPEHATCESTRLLQSKYQFLRGAAWNSKLPEWTRRADSVALQLCVTLKDRHAAIASLNWADGTVSQVAKAPGSSFGKSFRLLIDEAARMRVHTRIMSLRNGIIELEFQGKTALVKARIAGFSSPLQSHIGSFICDLKLAAYDVLARLGFTVPLTVSMAITKVPNVQLIAPSLEALLPMVAREATRLGYPVVIKPEGEGRGRGVTAHITHERELLPAMRYAFKEAIKSPVVLLQKHVFGRDYRCLCVDGKLAAAAIRRSARVTGDGKSTIQQLIDIENKNPARLPGHKGSLSPIVPDEEVHRVLGDKKMTLQTVPKEGEKVVLRKNANISTGGTAEDVTDRIHPQTVKLLEKIAQSCQLGIVGIDIRCADIAMELKSNADYCIIELNMFPGFRMHHNPTTGHPRNVCRAALGAFFPPLRGCPQVRRSYAFASSVTFLCLVLSAQYWSGSGPAPAISPEAADSGTEYADDGPGGD